MDRPRWCIVALSMMLVVAAISKDTRDSDPLREATELEDGGVWIFTCEQYCAYCGCVGNFLVDQNKCICSCERNSADLKRLDDVKQTKEFLGLNHTLEIHYFEPNHLEHGSDVRVTRQALLPNGRRSFARSPAGRPIPNPLQPRPGVRRPVAAPRPLLLRGQFAPRPPFPW